MKEKVNKIDNNKTPKEAKIVKSVTISFDGDQYLLRIPKKISDILEIKKGHKLKFILNLEYLEKTNQKVMVVELID